jgi:hypothetical protein
MPLSGHCLERTAWTLVSRKLSLVPAIGLAEVRRERSLCRRARRQFDARKLVLLPWGCLPPQIARRQAVVRLATGPLTNGDEVTAGAQSSGIPALRSPAK